MARWMRFFTGVLLAITLWAAGSAIASAGNSFVVGDLRIDLSEVYGSRYFRVWLMATDKPSTGDSRDFTTNWLGVFLGQYNGQPGSGQFSQVGLRAERAGLRWFVYAEPGVTCHRGQQTDWQHCYGTISPPDLVSLGTWHRVELYKDPQSGYWMAYVSDAGGTAYRVATINSTSSRIYLARMDTEEGYYEATDPFITVGYYHWHPQYLSRTVSLPRSMTKKSPAILWSDQ